MLWLKRVSQHMLLGSGPDLAVDPAMGAGRAAGSPIALLRG